MEESGLTISWFLWHFYEMPKFLWQIWKNFINFSSNFFSTGMLLKTLFSPWRRYNWAYPRGFNPAQYLEVLISNLFSRFMGAICRVSLIVLGFLFEIFVFAAGAIIFLGWLVLPILFLMGLFFALNIL